MGTREVATFADIGTREVAKIIVTTQGEAKEQALTRMLLRRHDGPIILLFSALAFISSPHVVLSLLNSSETHGIAIYLTAKTLSALLLLPLSYLVNKYRHDLVPVTLLVLCFYFATISYIGEGCIMESMIVTATGALCLSIVTFWAATIERELKPLILGHSVYLVSLLFYGIANVPFMVKAGAVMTYVTFILFWGLVHLRGPDAFVRRLEHLQFLFEYYAYSAVVVVVCVQAIGRGVGRIISPEHVYW